MYTTNERERPADNAVIWRPPHNHRHGGTLAKEGPYSLKITVLFYVWIRVDMKRLSLVYISMYVVGGCENSAGLSVFFVFRPAGLCLMRVTLLFG